MLGRAALSGLVLLASSNPITGELDKHNPPSQESLLDKVKVHLNEDGAIMEKHYLPKKDFLSSEGMDGLYLGKMYSINGKMFLEFHQIGESVFPLPHSSHGLGFSISKERPSWYFYEGVQYGDKLKDGINGNEELHIPKKQNPNFAKLNQTLV